MEELEMPSEYMLAISRIYEKIICCVRMNDTLSDFFNSTIGVKQGCPLLPTLFGLCIEELEEMISNFGNVFTMLLLYANDVMPFVNTLGDAQKPLKSLENCCMHTKLSVNISKTKIMVVKRQKSNKPCIIYNNEPLKCVESFKYLVLEVPSNYRWNECVTHRIEEGKRAYYAFENTRLEILSVGSSRNIFSTFW